MLTVGGTPDTDDSITLAAMIERVAVSVSEGELARAESHLRSCRAPHQPAADSDTKLRTSSRDSSACSSSSGARPTRPSAYLTPPPGRTQNEDRVQTRLLAWAEGRAGNFVDANAMFNQILEVERQNPGTPSARSSPSSSPTSSSHRATQSAAATHADLAIEKYDAFELPNDPDRLWAEHWRPGRTPNSANSTSPNHS